MSPREPALGPQLPPPLTENSRGAGVAGFRLPATNFVFRATQIAPRTFERSAEDADLSTPSSVDDPARPSHACVPLGQALLTAGVPTGFGTAGSAMVAAAGVPTTFGNVGPALGATAGVPTAFSNAMPALA